MYRQPCMHMALHAGPVSAITASYIARCKKSWGVETGSEAKYLLVLQVKLN